MVRERSIDFEAQVGSFARQKTKKNRRDETGHAHIYQARVGEQQTQKQILRDLLETVFEGSVTKLAIQALSVKKATPEELAEMRNLLDTLEKEAT